MLGLVSSMSSLELEDSKSNPVIETKLEPDVILAILEEREELPSAYLVFLRELGTSDKRDTAITLKILRLYVYARSQYRGDTKAIKNWLESGSLPSEKKFGGRVTMGLLYRKLRTFSKIMKTINELEEEIDVIVELQKVGNIKKQKITSMEKKEFKVSDLDSSKNSLLEEIMGVLDRFETLIAPRSDQ